MDLAEAKRISLELAPGPEAEKVPLEEAPGRVLQEDLEAQRDLPGELRSRLDGFAVFGADTSGAGPGCPVVLKVVPGVLAAGHLPLEPLRPGTCVRILTGAPLPAGADAVVAQERAREDGENLELSEPVRRGGGVMYPGADAREGGLLLSKGTVLTPSRLAILAALGCREVSVARKLRVGLLATGDEVRETGEFTEGPWTFCNNRLLLGWLVGMLGGNPIHLGVEKDDPAAIAGRIAEADVDMTITTGGIGRGARDFILEAWSLLRVTMLFRELNLSPGRNSALGVKRKRVFWAFPGNPWAAQVLFAELVVPVLLQSQGLGADTVPEVCARLTSPLANERGCYKSVRGILDLRSSPPAFAPLTDKTGPMLPSLRNSFAYTLLEPHVLEVAAGNEVRVRLHDLSLLGAALFGVGRSS
ncbi:MAG: molybdopterin molybdotransferase MoeA [Syntrophobacteraceae bacterium]|nr:molybdopterin molybdotransferase MoeA [Desulfobacteraceae bacterium]